MKGDVMADSSLLASLLDCAGKVFSLAGKLGLAFHEEHQGQGRQIEPAGWNRHALDFDAFCAALLDLRDAMQNPPDGFSPVAKPLLEAARIARAMRDAQARDGSFANCLDSFPALMTVSRDGWEATKVATNLRRQDDPFAFVDEPTATPDYSLLDRFPATPEGHVAFLEFVGNELCLAADAKRQQLDRGYSNDTLAGMVRGIKWTEARARAAALTTTYPEIASQLDDALAFDLSIAKIGELNEQYGRGISALWKASRKPTKPATPAELEIPPDGKMRCTDGVVAAHGVLLDEIMLGPRPGFGNTFPISDLDAIVVEGDSPSVCPKTDRPISPEWLPTILKAFNRVGLVKPGQTIHWVGGQAKLENLCTCFRDGFPSPDTAATDKARNGGNLMERLVSGHDDAELPQRELAQAATPAASDSEPGEPMATTGKLGNESATDSPTGFLGGAALADVIGIHATRRDAFFRQLERRRTSLGDNHWHEVRDPRPNNPRYLYRADSPKLRDLAAGYKTPKRA